MNQFKYRALVSVSNKNNLRNLGEFLLKNDFGIYSTGGTLKYLQNEFPEHHNHFMQVSDYTGFPEILGGRVKTLHPKIYGGILGRKSVESHVNEVKNHGIDFLDLVVVNLYPFKETISKDHSFSDAIENIDIGGVSLIRGSAKNFEDVLLLTEPEDYDDFVNRWGSDNINYEYRKSLASKGFHHVSRYDIQIAQYFDTEGIVYREYQEVNKLKYGCNPHQKYASINTINGGKFPFTTLNGQAGYINYLDALSAWQLVREVRQATGHVAATSFKHTAPAGVGISVPLTEELRNMYQEFNEEVNNSKPAIAFLRARNSDPLSSFGDFIAISDKVDVTTAKLIKREVSDGIVAPEYEPEALEILCSKKGGKYLVMSVDNDYINENDVEYREIYGITMAQTVNNAVTDDNYFGNEATKSLSMNNLENLHKIDMMIANIALKYTPSNSVAYAKGGQVIGIGAGQQNRVDCVKLAGKKASNWFMRSHPRVLELWGNFREGVKRQDKVNAVIDFINGLGDEDYERWLNNFVDGYRPDRLRNEDIDEYISRMEGFSLVSDAFFPFRDSIDCCNRYGVKYILQPGGSSADEGIIKACEEYNMRMFFSNVRMFYH